jgi:hypothetical protein
MSRTYRVVLAGSIFLPRQRVSMHVRDHRFSVHNRCRGISNSCSGIRSYHSGVRNHRLGIRSPYVGIDRQLGL